MIRAVRSAVRTIQAVALADHNCCYQAITRFDPATGQISRSMSVMAILQQLLTAMPEAWVLIVKNDPTIRVQVDCDGDVRSAGVQRSFCVRDGLRVSRLNIWLVLSETCLVDRGR